MSTFWHMPSPGVTCMYMLCYPQRRLAYCRYQRKGGHDGPTAWTLRRHGDAAGPRPHVPRSDCRGGRVCRGAEPPELWRGVFPRGSAAVLELLDKVKRLPRASVITRLRLDAALYDPPPQRKPRAIGRPRLKGKRRPTLEAVLADKRTQWTTLRVEQWYGKGPREVEVVTDTAVWYHTGEPPVAIRWVLIRDPQKRFKPQALLSTTLEHTPAQILPGFVRRWTLEVTFEEVRAHLGMETQRQWNERAIARTTPALLSLYSIVTLTAQLLIEKGSTCVRNTAWYRKTHPTFSDAIALVRRQLWEHLHFSTSPQEADMIKIPRALFERFIDAVCYAA